MRHWGRLRDERGMALALAVLIMSVLSISVVAVITYSTSNATWSDRARVDEATLFAAEAGIDEALSRLNAATDPRVSSLVPSTTTTVGGSTVTYSGTFDTTTNRWTIVSSATTPAPVGATSPLVRTVSQSLQVSAGAGTVADNPAWKYVYADRTDGCTELHSSSEITQPVYVRNDLCLYSSARIYGSAGEVQVGGPLGIWKQSTSSFIGQSGSPVATLRVDNRGCKLTGTYGETSGYQWFCDSSQNVHATTQLDTLTAVTKPPLDLAANYAAAAPGPLNPCGAGSAYNGGAWPADFFDSNTTLGDSTAVRNLMPNFDYTCKIGGATKLAWDYTGAGPGTMTIDGTVFIDGNIQMTSSEKGTYTGRGTIYVSRRITLGSSPQLCGKPDTSSACDWAGWDPNGNLLVLVAGDMFGTTSATCGSGGLGSHTCSIFMGSSTDFQGGLYAQNMIWLDSSSQVQGPMIGHGVRLESSSNSLAISLDALPPGAPAGNSSWQVLPIVGTWREP